MDGRRLGGIVRIRQKSFGLKPALDMMDSVAVLWAKLLIGTSLEITNRKRVAVHKLILSYREHSQYLSPAAKNIIFLVWATGQIVSIID